MSLSIVDIDIQIVKPYEKNPRKGHAIDKIAESLQQFSFRKPIVVDADYVIISGHGVYQAALKLGYATVPVHVATELTPEKVKAYRIADNRSGEDSAWDDLLLQAELLDLDSIGYDTKRLGFSEEQLNQIRNGVVSLPTDDPEGDVNDVPSVDEVDTFTCPGDVWDIGPHRLVCGDATLIDHYKLPDGVLADLIVTDPPYNVAYQGKTADRLTIQNDNLSNDAFFEFLKSVFTNLFLVAKDGCTIYVAHADTEGLNFRRAFCESGFLLKQCCIWVKNTFVMGRQDYHWQHEPILYGWKPGAAHIWESDRKQTTVWNFDKPQRNAEHPTMKPVELIAYAIMNSSRPGAWVVDAFGGSGTTMVAAHQTGRRAFLLELDPKYCDVIIRRMLNLWPTLPVLLNGTAWRREETDDGHLH